MPVEAQQTRNEVEGQIRSKRRKAIELCDEIRTYLDAFDVNDIMLERNFAEKFRTQMSSVVFTLGSERDFIKIMDSAVEDLNALRLIEEP